MRRTQLAATALWAVLLAIPSRAQAPAPVEEVQAKAEPAPLPGWLERFRGSSVGLTSAVGSGTLVANPYSDNPYVDTALSFRPVFSLDEHQSLSLSWGFSFEYTQPDNAEGRRYVPEDVSLSYAHRSLWTNEATGLRLGGMARILLPTSYESRFNGTLFNALAGPTLSRSFFGEKLSLSLASRFVKYFPRSPNRGLSRDDPRTDTGPAPAGSSFTLPSAYCRDEAAFCSGGSLNANYAFHNTVSGSYALNDKLSLSASFGIRNVFKFAVPEEHADPDLPRVGRSDLTVGELSLSWQMLPRLGLSGGVSSTQPALTADNRALRFPLYDFVSPANNFTTWFLSLEATL